VISWPGIANGAGWPAESEAPSMTNWPMQVFSTCNYYTATWKWPIVQAWIYNWLINEITGWCTQRWSPTWLLRWTLHSKLTSCKKAIITLTVLSSCLSEIHQMMIIYDLMLISETTVPLFGLLRHACKCKCKFRPHQLQVQAKIMI